MQQRIVNCRSPRRGQSREDDLPIIARTQRGSLFKFLNLTPPKRPHADDVKPFEVDMSQNQDFDFKIGRGHYRGRGSHGLIALAIVHLPQAALFGSGVAVATPAIAWLVQLLRALVGH
jgi:hypothetical protein